MKYLLLDRDGTINVDKDCLSDPEDIEFCSGTVDGLKRMQRGGIKFFILTNQSWIAKGKLTIAQYKQCEERLLKMLADEGIQIAAVRYCPHRKEDLCECRKPKIGMWESLRKEFPELNEDECAMVGDMDRDVLLGKNIGCMTFRIDSGKFPVGEKGDYLVKNLNEVADILLG